MLHALFKKAESDGNKRGVSLYAAGPWVSHFGPKCSLREKEQELAEEVIQPWQ